jgi:ligand-binding sensor domain-containing protein
MTGLQPEPVKISAAAGFINQMATDTAGRIWLGTENQLLVQTGRQFQTVPPPPGEQKFSVTAIFPTRNGALWVVANEHLWKWQAGDWRLDAGPWPAHQSSLRLLLEDRDGSLWFSQYGSGLLCLDRDGQTRKLTTQNGLSGDLVRCLFQDREGNLWVGIDRGGLIRLRKKIFQVLGTSDRFSDPVALAVCEDTQGAIWASTYGGGLNRWADGKFTGFNFGPDGSPGYLFTVFPDREGRLWVGTRDNGVFIGEAGEFRQIISTNAIPLPVRAIFQDREGTVWLGSGGGVFCWRAGKLESFAADTELAHADIRGFAEDSEGALWIGTHGNGLHRFQAGQHTALHTADGLPNEFIRSLLAACCAGKMAS